MFVESVFSSTFLHANFAILLKFFVVYHMYELRIHKLA